MIAFITAVLGFFLGAMTRAEQEPAVCDRCGTDFDDEEPTAEIEGPSQ